MKLKSAAISCLLLCWLSCAQGQTLNPNAPKLGNPAPPLTYTQLLQAPEGTKADWPSLRGKVVVLEFWATWCGPCIAEIPVLNHLADSLDSRKVQFIAVDDEDPDKVQAFLKKNPISGWVMLDTTEAVFKQFDVGPRPTTIVVDTKGRVVSTAVRPEHLQRDALLQLAMGKPIVIETATDAETADADNRVAMAQLRAAMQTAEKNGSDDALFSLSITRGDASQTTVLFPRGQGQLDVINATPDKLLIFALGIPTSRVKVNGELAKTAYSLHLHAPSMDAGQLAQSIDLAIQSACGVWIERHTSIQDVYILQAMDKTKPLPNLASDPEGSVAFYDAAEHSVQFMHASVDQIAKVLEQAVDRPVLNESGVTAQLAATFTLPSGNFEALKSALEKNTGLTLVPAKRPVETFTLTPRPNPETPKATSAKPAL